MAGNATQYLNTATLPEFSDLIKKEFVLHNENVQPAAMDLFIREDLTAHTEDRKRYDELDLDTFGRLKREGEKAKRSRSGVGYNKTLIARRFALETVITWEMRRFGNQHRLKSELTNMRDFIPRRMELDLNHRFTFCNATSYTDIDGESVDVSVGDGLALVSTSHTLAHSSTTYSNRVSGDPIFSAGSLETAESLFVTDIYNNFGQIRTVSPNTIVTGRDPNTVKDVKRVMQSTADVDGAHSGIVNVDKGMYRHVVLPYLDTDALGGRDATKKRWWFLVAAGVWQGYVGIFESPNMKTPPAQGNNGEDPHTDDWVFNVRGMWGIAVVSAKGLVGSLPTS